MLSLGSSQRWAGTGIPTLNKASLYAQQLYCWFPLNGQPCDASTTHVPVDQFTAFATVTKWNGTTRGLAYDGITAGSSGRITTNQGMQGLGTLSRATLTARIWINTASTFNRVVQLGQSAGNGQLSFLMAASTTDVDFIDPTENVDMASGVTTANTWCDLVGVYDSGVQKALWVNGKKTALTTRTGSASITSQSLIIANRPEQDRGFDGYITDVGIWTYPWPDAMCYGWYDPRTRWDLYWQPNTRAYSFMSVAASAGGYLLVKN